MRLTPDEARLVAFLLSALLLGSTVKYRRAQERMAQHGLGAATATPRGARQAAPTPTPPRAGDEDSPRP